MANHSHKATFILRIMYQSAAALWLKLQSAVAELRRHQLAAIMPRGFDIAMEHICREAEPEPFLDLVDYGRLACTSRVGAYNVFDSFVYKLLADEHQFFASMERGFEFAVFHICKDSFLNDNDDDYHNLHASSCMLRKHVLIGCLSQKAI